MYKIQRKELHVTYLPFYTYELHEFIGNFRPVRKIMFKLTRRNEYLFHQMDLYYIFVYIQIFHNMRTTSFCRVGNLKNSATVVHPTDKLYSNY